MVIRSAAVMAGATALSCFLSSAAYAQSLPAPGQTEEGWRHTLGFYLFTPLRTHGTSTVSGVSADIDLDLGDVLDVLDFAAAGRYEAWNGDFGIIVDANYVGIGEDTTLPGPAATAVDVDVRQKWFAVMGAYRVADGTYGANNQRYTVDLQGGIRYNSIRQEIRFTTPGPTNPPTQGGDEGWIEPVVGARGMWRLNDRWTTIASLELGGFGAGGNDLQVGANIGFDYKPWDRTAITFGYRYFSVDYSDSTSTGPFAYDVTQQGPYVGLKVFFN